jgi:hypothetical protein
VTAPSGFVGRAVLLAFGLLILCLDLAFALAPGDVAADSPEAVPSSHQAEIIEWRRLRHGRLTSPDGWLTLVGLEWLREGDNRVGSADASDIRIPGGPASWGTVTLANNELIFVPAAQSDLTIDGAPARRVRLVPDDEGEPTVVSHGDLSFYVILRGSYAVRVKDRRAPTLLAFDGVENYPIDSGWRFEARFLPAEPGQTIEIANVLGQTESMAVGGTVEFERDGQTYRLLGVLEKGVSSLWFLFADRTNGRETYGAGRFLYSNGMPENGRVVVDFNKAYNPPCAFNDYSTCPLPPQQNRLDLAVMAGEKGYHHQ